MGWLWSIDERDFDDAYPEGSMEALIDDDATIILNPEDESI